MPYYLESASLFKSVVNELMLASLQFQLKCTASVGMVGYCTAVRGVDVSALSCSFALVINECLILQQLADQYRFSAELLVICVQNLPWDSTAQYR